MLTFDISIRVRAHAAGGHTVRVLNDSALWAWGLDVDQLLEDLQLALIDRLERSHPSLLHSFQAPRGRSAQQVQAQLQFKMAGTERQEEAVLPVDVVVEPDLDHQRVRVPALSASLWLRDGEAVDAAVVDLVEKMLDGATLPGRLEVRLRAGVELQTLQLEIEPAPLASFTGTFADAMLLPEPEPEKTEEEKLAETRKPTPTLDRIAMEMTADRAGLAGALGRELEVAELLRMLEQPGAAVIVVGPDLAGKTAVVEQVAKELKSRRGWFLDASRLVHADFRMGWRRQTLEAVTELGETEDVWFVGNPLPLLDAGKHVGSDMNVAQVLKPFLSNGQLRLIGECSEAAWGRLEGKDAGFARLFTPYRLSEPPQEQALAILHALAPTLPVAVAKDGVTASLELAHRYGPVDARMGTAAHFLRRLAAEARATGRAGPLGRPDVLARFCAETGLPPLLVRDDLPLDPAAVRASFQEALVGQDHAVDLLVDLIAVIKGGMSDLDRPLGSFLFVGPTGVGKTEAAKALARWLFGGTDASSSTRLLRFDMSEFSGPDCVARLLAPDSGLVAAVRRRPFAVVLLDEIEKAHPAIFDLLLQVLGEARLSDANGNVADFRNTVVLLTSNLGVGTFRRPTGFGGDPAAALQEHVLTQVQAFFRPEFFNRLDRVVPFNSLGADAIGHIATREVAAVARRPGLRTRGVELAVDEESVAWLAERGVDPAFGARPLKRAVQDHLVAPLARHLAGRGQAASVAVSVDGDALRFDNQEPSTTHSHHDALRQHMVRLSDLRYVARCWMECSRAGEARHELGLVDRLMASKRFWADHQAALARSNALEPVRNAMGSLRDAVAGLEAVEDLVHEAWVAREAGNLDTLTDAVGDAAAALDESCLQLAGARLPHADKIRLFFYPIEDDTVGWKRQLMTNYVELAVAMGWTVAWGEFRWPSEKGSIAVFLKRASRGPKSVVELDFEGPNAATLLLGESGAHVLKHPSGPIRARVAATLGKHSPKDVPERRFRLYDPGRKQVVDVGTKLTTTLHAQQHRSLRKMLDLRLVAVMLGDELGRRIWKGYRG